jgi:hypothetical protein
MSEFSESFHFAQSTREEIAASLKAAGMKGVLFGPSETGWVTFVPFEGCEGHQLLAGPYTDFSNSLSRITNKAVLEWVYAEDHCWFVFLAEAGQRVATYSGDWSEGAAVIQSDKESAQKFLALPGRESARDEILKSMPATLREEDIFGDDDPHAYRLAEALGLPRYQWLSSQYATADMSAKEMLVDGHII